MAITRQFAVTCDELLENPEYREALLVEIIDIMLAGEAPLAQDMYEDYKKWQESHEVEKSPQPPWYSLLFPIGCVLGILYIIIFKIIGFRLIS